ncbi:MAG: glycine--tRNA ligase subunit beta [Rhodobacteraceae bacterium]|nr:glycine--tRNA ligase subunit beta [Paracoccaceae bacterium]
MADLLLELFSEEIPARMQKRAGEDLQRLVTDGLVEAGLSYQSAAAFVTPRRLCLNVCGLSKDSPTVREERKGPRVDAPDKAIEGFLRGVGLSRDQLEVRDEKKGQVYFAAIEKPGRSAFEILAELIPQVIRNFPWPKSMRWGTGQLRWVRPLHSILCVLYDENGTDVVDFEVDGIASCDQAFGHRFMGPKWFYAPTFDLYRKNLAKNFVMLDAQERSDHIWADATNLAFAQGLEVVEDKGLLAEVAGLVEWPVVLLGDIAEDFFDLPVEVLQTSMREHQKFFSVRNPRTGRIEKFITVANRETADQGATILAGNQKVLFARLSDAKFFWENDLRTIEQVGMTGMAKPLENVTFHNKLGSQAERIERIAALAREIAPIVGAKPDLAEEAARIVKADLSSQMVGEFPELQGVMGRYYAERAGHNDGVPEACEAHYSPLGPSDDVPSEPVSVAVALADKIDTLTGFWVIKEKPTGSKDPFALRRTALGVVRLVLENGIRMEFKVAEGPAISRARGSAYQQLLKTAIEIEPHKLIRKTKTKVDKSEHEWWQEASNALIETTDNLDDIWIEFASRGKQGRLNYNDPTLLTFFHDRLKVYLRDQGITHDVIDACLAMPGNDDFTLLVNRATALQVFLNTDNGENLLQGFKRANNILSQAEEKDGVEYSYGADQKFGEADEEKALFGALEAVEAAIAPAVEAEDFAAAMSAMAGLRGPIDAFFEAVKVNADRDIIRRNRLNLLGQIRKVMGQVADFTRLEG